MKRTLTRSEGQHRGKQSVKMTLSESKINEFFDKLNKVRITMMDFVRKYLKAGEYQNFATFLKLKATSPLKLPIFEGAIIKFLEEK